MANEKEIIMDDFVGDGFLSLQGEPTLAGMEE
ncbi:hypothetical protein BWQ96_06903 [Gracilariopsis chorda]|uniref:Uncharacterized protein n=1 Tax=Gracilariopsis chorda TaxID=448386 RepID=A0A2V3IQC2_9FLOR|nr:hypothetical protein BWQ96_06903 [Gracilariopsis chorda]|eukprot:PXF43340.1 hypothetical protein BWQ96_06903 [Gracilariopsis chorda]